MNKYFYPNDGGLKKPVRAYRNTVANILIEHFKKIGVSKDQ